MRPCRRAPLQGRNLRRLHRTAGSAAEWVRCRRTVFGQRLREWLRCARPHWARARGMQPTLNAGPQPWSVARLRKDQRGRLLTAERLHHHDSQAPPLSSEPERRGGSSRALAMTTGSVRPTRTRRRQPRRPLGGQPSSSNSHGWFGPRGSCAHAGRSSSSLGGAAAPAPRADRPALERIPTPDPGGV